MHLNFEKDLSPMQGNKQPGFFAELIVVKRRLSTDEALNWEL